MKNKKNPFQIKRLSRFKKKPLKPNPLFVFSTKTVSILKYAGLAFLTLGLSAFMYFNGPMGFWFKASVLDLPQAFDGTVMPIKKVPNWTYFKGDKTTLYASIPADQLIEIPPYDPGLLAFPNEKLEWGNPAHDIIRNTKITYSVVYLGSYEKNHDEGAGSHLAFDIKVPQGTPLYAIANGKVTLASTQNNGFGHHVVLKHINVPDPDLPGRFTTLYSTYAHMDEVLVAEGQNVLKGQQIGTSGNTGTSTTPHLHFQIDKDSAPWHPYWPFTWKESQDAGLSFFEAVNAGLGISNARANTINPIAFVNRHLNGSGTLVAGDTPVAPPETNNPPAVIIEEVTETPDDVAPVTTPVENNSPTVNEKPFDTTLFAFALSGDQVGLLNNGITVVVKDQQDQIKQLGDNDSIQISIDGVGQSLVQVLRKSDFSNNTATFTVKSSEPGLSTVTVGKSSFQITFIEKVSFASALQFEHDGAFQENALETMRLIAVDENGNPTPAVNFPGQVVIEAKEGAAEIIPNRLNAQDFLNGVATLRVKVSGKDRVVLRAQNGALVGESSALHLESSDLFSDINRRHNNYDAIKYLKEENIISGYPDGSFKPEKTVNRVEALKMLMLAFGVQAGAAEKLPFADTDNSAWYANTLSAALSKEIVKGYADGTFKPAQTVNRAEYLKILFNSSGVPTTNVNVVAKPYEDVEVSAWFAAYAYLANQKNLMEIEGKLFPAEGMTRAEVAETIYRLKMIQQKNLVSFSK